MKLDESIELINKKKNINEMNNLTNLSVSEMRNCMHEMMTDDNMSGCLYEVLTQEGFLPETLAEGEDYGTHCSTMMEDDMIAEEMFKSCCTNESECEAACPKEISVENIARMNREYMSASLTAE